VRVLDLTMTILCWGLWAFLPKLAQRHLGDATSGIIYQYLGSIALVLVLVVSQGRRMPVYDLRGALFAIAAGAAATVGSLFYYRALATVDVSVAAALTALYPSVAILLGLLLLGERLEHRQWLGVALALVSVALIAPRS
jgi:bacterial/archaeal transporter family protein